MLSPARNQPHMSRFEDQVASAVAGYGFFAPERPIWVARAPGRLDVMGGNVDYTGGMVLQGLLREATWAAVQPRPDDIIRILNPGIALWDWQPYLEFRIHDIGSLQSLRALSEQEEGLRW